MKNDVNIISEGLIKEKKYWTDKFSGFNNSTNVNYEFNKKASTDYKRKIIVSKLSDDISSKLLKISNNSDEKLQIILVASVVSLMYKLTGSNDIVVGSSVDIQENDQNLINSAYFLKNQLSGGECFKDIILNVRQTINEAIEHQNYPVEAILKLTNTSASPNINLSDVFVILESIQKKEYLDKLNPNIIFVFNKSNDQIHIQLEYNTQYYSEKTANLLNELYKLCTKELLNNINESIGQIHLQHDFFNNLLKCSENLYSNSVDNESIYNIFKDQVKKTPFSKAIELNGQSLNYEKLNEKVNGFANILHEKNITKGSVVAIYLPKSINQIVSIIASLKLGLVFLPLNDEIPLKRLKFILEDSNADLIISSKELMPNIDSNIQKLDCDKIGLSNNGSIINEVAIKNNDPVYILYTSGSTGKPKGVIIGHQSLKNYLIWSINKYAGNKKVNFPFFTSIGFDLTLTSIFTPLLTGGKIIIYNQKQKDIALKNIILDNEVDIIKLTPSHLKILREFPEKITNSKLKKIIVGGEDLNKDLSRDIYKKYNCEIEIINEYGPTEATIGCMNYTFNFEKDNQESISIGDPISNTEICLLDENLNDNAPFSDGEMYISGKCLAIGYLNRIELTKERFIPNPNNYKEILYKSGDLASKNSEGQVFFKGRTDKQIKLNGNRIEIAEIETALRGVVGIKDSFVHMFSNDLNDGRIVAFYTGNNELDTENIIKALKLNLPDYMIPSNLIFVKEFPLTENDKIDIEKLQELDRNYENVEIVEPFNDTQRKIIQIWKNKLRIDNIGIKNNFFNSGGDSIKSISIINALNEEFNIKLEIVDLYQNETAEKLALKIENFDKKQDDDNFNDVISDFDNLKNEILNS